MCNTVSLWLLNTHCRIYVPENIPGNVADCSRNTFRLEFEPFSKMYWVNRSVIFATGQPFILEGLYVSAWLPILLCLGSVYSKTTMTGKPLTLCQNYIDIFCQISALTYPGNKPGFYIGTSLVCRPHKGYMLAVIHNQVNHLRYICFHNRPWVSPSLCIVDAQRTCPAS
jgi:hypothetical protein